MTSVQRVRKLCSEKNIAISKLEKDLGFSNGYIGSLKKGTFPDDRLYLIANYLKVSPEYLSSGITNKKSSATTNSDGTKTDEITDYIMNIVKVLPIEYKIRLASELQSLKLEVQGQDSQKESS